MAAETDILLETGTNELELIEFSLKYPDTYGKMIYQSFGINVAKVREIIRVPQITKLPGQHETLLGIFKLRDELIPVMNLADWLYHYKERDDKQKLIVTEFNALKVGFIVHDVERIHRLSWMQVESPDNINDLDFDNSSVVGLIKSQEKIILMLDIEKILAEINPDLGINAMSDKIIQADTERKILLAEDSVTIRNMLTQKLRAAGYQIKSFHNGLAAWEHLQELAVSIEDPGDIFQTYDLVITDIEMPKLDGYSLTKNIKTHEKLSGLPVIIFSSMITDDARHKGESVGADAQFSKPQIDCILDSMEEIIKKRDEKIVAV